MGELKERIRSGNRIEDLRTAIPFPKKRLLLELTNICNHRCLFCANSKMTRAKGFMDKGFASRILREAYDLGMREVGFYATGEPFVVKDLSSYIRIAKETGYEYTYCTTNGALATEERIADVLDAGLDSIKFSINAGTRTSYKKIHGADNFDDVVSHVKYVDFYRKKYGKMVKLYVSCILTKQTEQERDVLRDLLQDYVDEIIFINVMNMGGMMYEVNESLMVKDDEDEYLPTTPCALLFNAVTITYEGYLTACCTDFQNYLVVEDLNQVSLAEAWNGESFRKLREMHLNNRIEGTLCYNCVGNKNDTVKPLHEEYATIYDAERFTKLDEIRRMLR